MQYIRESETRSREFRGVVWSGWMMLLLQARWVNKGSGGGDNDLMEMRARADAA